MQDTNQTADPSGAVSKRTGVRRLTTLTLLLALLAAFLSPATAGAQAEPETISGNAVPSDCAGNRGAGAIRLTGDLTGCLIFYPSAFECTELKGFALYQESGRELFIGRYKGERGRFRTTYTLEATYTSGSCADFNAGGFPWQNQLTGGCDHLIDGRRGAFAGMSGLITFHDVIPRPGTSGASNFYYSGTLG